jgi:isopentenyl diphosphate isomerase/L-lactate dehydrogenase-like FMN-dependent dehydrogenase
MALDLDRRAFLQFLAASPLAAPLPDAARRLLAAARVQDRLITSPADAVNVLEFEAAARQALPPAHWAYLATGVDDDATLRANRDGYARLQLRSRRLVDVSHVNLGLDLLGQRLDNPIIVSPCGSQRAFHQDGELATARAARARNHLQILSTVATTSIEDVTAARGAPVWFQLYPPVQWDATRALLARAEAAGSPVVVLTVDLNPGSNRETLLKAIAADDRNCADCHDTAPGGSFRRKPMLSGLGRRDEDLDRSEMTWDYVRRLRDATRMKLVIKGIVTREDAALARSAGVDGIVVSNHGGRAEESGRATIESLPEVVEAVGGAFPVILDGGIRRGTDIVKALALGATAVGIGRPYLWGLAAFGQAGVERVLELLRAELQLAMRHVGATSLREIRRETVVTR